jgi:F0F1-type ATP synthase membrane subunit a
MVSLMFIFRNKKIILLNWLTNNNADHIKINNEPLQKEYYATLNVCIYIYILIGNRIGAVMVRVLASSAVDRLFHPGSDQTKDFKIGMLGFSAKHASLRK